MAVASGAGLASGLGVWPVSTAIEAVMPVSLSPTSSHARAIPTNSDATRA